MDDLKALIAKVASGAALTLEESAQAFDRMMSGEATPSQMGGLLMALRVRGETVDEITGAVRTMRSKMLLVEAPADAIDVVGTGGDASGSFNISTCAAFIVAGAGVPVAKHGNRALSSRCGAADVLAALGVRIELPPDAISRCIREADENAAALLDVLKGRKGPFRDVALLNAAAALLVAGRAHDLEGGILLAKKSVDSGEAEGRLDRLLAVSNA